MSLSGGQKQRVALARAVLKESPIMIFDDATSALDLKTEASFYNELAKTSPHSTKIIVAQRIASVCRAHRILILENGTVVAEGTHKELLKNCAIYQDIYQSQVGDVVSEENKSDNEPATQQTHKNATPEKENTVTPSSRTGEGVSAHE